MGRSIAERDDGRALQIVAIKLISIAVGHAGQARFEREAQLLAQIEHPAVARLVDAGVERGRAWIAMEFVNGLRIDDYCRAKELGVRDIVGLLAQLAGAVAAAHRMLVVHNDIKPANVLVTSEGVPKLIDFGISRALREAGAAEPGGPATAGVAQLFSPGFAAPEQISGGPVTVATDVFGLGALAYRLLTGRSTYPDAVEPLDYMLAMAQRDVELASRAAQKAGRAVEARQLQGDLDAILSKALERDPMRRYASAMDMQGDLLSYLARRPVNARLPTFYYRAGKFVRRNLLAVSLAAVSGGSHRRRDLRGAATTAPNRHANWPRTAQNISKIYSHPSTPAAISPTSRWRHCWIRHRKSWITSWAASPWCKPRCWASSSTPMCHWADIQKHSRQAIANPRSARARRQRIGFGARTRGAGRPAARARQVVGRAAAAARGRGATAAAAGACGPLQCPGHAGGGARAYRPRESGRSDVSRRNRHRDGGQRGAARAAHGTDVWTRRHGR